MKLRASIITLAFAVCLLIAPHAAFAADGTTPDGTFQLAAASLATADSAADNGQGDSPSLGFSTRIL